MSNFDDFMISEAVSKNQEIQTLLDERNTARALSAELLAALKDVLEARDESGDCGDHCYPTCRWCIARAAIAKAEGRQ